MTTNEITTVDRGPHTVARQALVHAGADELFALLANPHRHHEADGSGSVLPEVIGPRELRTGDKFRVNMTMARIPYAITSTATDIVPGRRVEWQHPGGHRWRWEFEPHSDGSTLVTEVFDYSGARIPAIYEFIKAPQRNAAGIEASLRRLQSRFGG